MSIALSFCPNLVAPAPRPRLAPGKGMSLLGISVALVVAALTSPGPASAPRTDYRVATLVAGQGTSPAALLVTAEAMRARLLAVPGVGAVSLHGLQPGGLLGRTGY